VLSTADRGRVVGGSPRVEIADLGAKADESPELEIHTAAIVEGSVVHKPGRGIWVSIESLGALLIDCPTTSHREIGRHPTIGKELHANPGRQKNCRCVSSKRLIRGIDLTKRVGKKVNLSV